MSAGSTIICRPSKWFIWRALAIFTMLSLFSLYFLYDWKVGYPKSNFAYYVHQAFEKDLKESFAKHREEGRSDEEWITYARAQKVSFPEEMEALPKGVDSDMSWPEITQDIELLRRDGWHKLWLDYSKKAKLKSEPGPKPKSVAAIKEQLYWAIGVAVLALGALLLLFRNLSRRMKADLEAYYAPGGQKILFTQIKRIDARKWKSKGLATIFYQTEGGKDKKARIDGMIYGQFDAEKGQPAEQLYQRVVENFKGELIELVEVDEDEESETESNS